MIKVTLRDEKVGCCFLEVGLNQVLVEIKREDK